MSKDAKKLVFGIHGVTIMDYFTGLPIAELDVIGDLSIPVTAEVESIYGGNHVWPVAGQPITISAEGELELREFPEDIAEYLAAGVGAATVAAATGSVTALANYFGTGCMSATVGIASVGIKTGENANLKAGMYMVKVMSASTVDVFACSSVDLKKGTDLALQDDAMKITATALSVTTGAAVAVPSLGVEFTGGSGTIGMTVGDTAYFEIYPPHAGVETITLGAAGAEFKSVALMLTARKQTTGEIGYIHCPNALALGIPFGMPEKGWSGGKVDLKVFTHETLNYSMKFTHIKGTTV
jgi:hypothetical protein